MKNNVGGIDRSVRIVAGIAIIAAGVFYQSYWAVIGLVHWLLVPSDGVLLIACLGCLLVAQKDTVEHKLQPKNLYTLR